MLFSRPRNFVIDLETVADPRVVRFLEFGLVAGRFTVPEPPARAESEEAKHLADRAREGIERLRKIKGVTVRLDPGLADRDRLAAALRKHKATLITANPGYRAAFEGLPVVTTTDIYELFKPVHLSGNQVLVRVSKRGKEKDEGIGFLEGGVKVVVEGGVEFLGQEIEVVVQGALETDGGRIIFARPRFTEVK
jgi:uncharacterized protein YacL